MLTKKYSYTIDLSLLVLVSAFIFLIFIGERPLSVPSEARYAEIPREMLELGNYLIPHLNYVEYFEKPPLFYWLQATVYALFDVSTWSARLINVLMAILGSAATYIAGRYLYDRKTGLLAGFILTTSILYFGFSQIITLDMALATLLTISLFLFLMATQNTQPSKYMLWLAYAFAAFAVLTKGLIGIVFPIIIIAAWIICTNQWRLILRMRLFSGLLLFLLIVLPWHLYMYYYNSSFWDFYIIDQHFARFSQSGTLSDYNRHQGWWLFLLAAPLGMFPWLAFLVQAIKFNFSFKYLSKQQINNNLFLLIWIVSIILFFSVSRSQLLPYIAPVFAPLAVLIASYLSKAWQPAVPKGIYRGFWLLLILSIILGIASFALLYYIDLLGIKIDGLQLAIIASMLTASGILYLIIIKWFSIKSAIVAVVIVSSAIYIAIKPLLIDIDDKNVEPLALVLQPMLKADDKVASYNTTYYDLNFYLQRPLIQVNNFGELGVAINMMPISPDWFIDSRVFWPLWNSEQQVYVITRIDDFLDVKQQFEENYVYIIAKTDKNILLTNKPVAID